MGIQQATGMGRVAGPPVAPAGSVKGAWGIAFLLFLYMLVNFADKIIVGLAGKPIADELRLTPEQFGFLGSAFFFLFSISAIGVGFLADRLPTRWILLVLAVIWAVVQFPMLMDVSYETLVLCRIILGAGEGPAYAVAVHALYKWFPDEKRAIPTAILSQGSAFGVILAVPALNWVIVNYSWHAAFGALGVFGLFWVVLWLIFGREGPLQDKPATTGEMTSVPYGDILLSRTFIGCCLATFGAYWALSLGLTWFTPYLRELGFDQKTAGLISVLPWLFGATIVLLTGIVSQILVGRGVSTRTARGVLGATPVILGGLVLASAYFVDTTFGKVALLVVGSGLASSIYVVCPPMIGEFVPSSQRGASIAIYGAVYTLAGVLAPWAMGRVIQTAVTPLVGYQTGFLIQAAILVVSGIIGLLLLWPNLEKARIADRAGAMLPA